MHNASETGINQLQKALHLLLLSAPSGVGAELHQRQATRYWSCNIVIRRKNRGKIVAGQSLKVCEQP